MEDWLKRALRTQTQHIFQQTPHACIRNAGVESAALSGQDKNQLEVVGDGIDARGLTELLKKSVGFAELVTEGQVPEKKNGGGDQKKNEATAPVPVAGHYPYPYPYGAGHVYEIRDHNRDNCSIM